MFSCLFLKDNPNYHPNRPLLHQHALMAAGQQGEGHVQFLQRKRMSLGKPFWVDNTKVGLIDASYVKIPMSTLILKDRHKSVCTV